MCESMKRGKGVNVSMGRVCVCVCVCVNDRRFQGVCGE